MDAAGISPVSPEIELSVPSFKQTLSMWKEKNSRDTNNNTKQLSGGVFTANSGNNIHNQHRKGAAKEQQSVNGNTAGTKQEEVIVPPSNERKFDNNSCSHHNKGAAKEKQLAERVTEGIKQEVGNFPSSNERNSDNKDSNDQRTNAVKEQQLAKDSTEERKQEQEEVILASSNEGNPDDNNSYNDQRKGAAEEEQSANGSTEGRKREDVILSSSNEVNDRTTNMANEISSETGCSDSSSSQESKAKDTEPVCPPLPPTNPTPNPTPVSPQHNLNEDRPNPSQVQETPSTEDKEKVVSLTCSDHGQPTCSETPGVTVEMLKLFRKKPPELRLNGDTMFNDSFASVDGYDSGEEPLMASYNLDDLKAMALRLNLATRRPSFVEWQEKHLVDSSCDKSQVLDSVSEDEGTRERRSKRTGDWSREKKESIDSALEWLRKELLDMRLADHKLAKQLMNLRRDIHRVKLQHSSAQHKVVLEEAFDQIQDERDDISELSDMPHDQLSPTLKQFGVTRMNLSTRRFSVF